MNLLHPGKPPLLLQTAACELEPAGVGPIVEEVRRNATMHGGDVIRQLIEALVI
jgi:hypothetical protein